DESGKSAGGASLSMRLLHRSFGSSDPAPPSGNCSTSSTLRPEIQLLIRWREVQGVVLGKVGNKERLALATVDQDPHQQHVLEDPGRHDLMALDDTIFVLRAVRAPVRLKSIEGVGCVFVRMLLPIWVVHPDAVGRLQIVFL